MLKKIKLIFNSKLIFRFIFTLFIIFIFILGRSIQIPFLNVQIQTIIQLLKGLTTSDKFLINFDLNNFNLLSLSIYPYITISIFIQLVQKFIPHLKEWREQGEVGKQKLNRLTRFLAILLAMFQSYLMINKYSGNKESGGEIFIGEKLYISFFLATGTAIAIWLSDLITAKGVGNGTSILIMVGMSSGVITTFQKIFAFWNTDKIKFFALLFFLLFILISTIIVYLATLKIPIIYPNKKSQVENYIPLKINVPGVLPIILTSTMQAFFMFCINNIPFFNQLKCKDKIIEFISISTNLGIIFFVCLIIFFSFLTAFLIVNTNDIAEHLSKQDAYIENCRPGKQTVEKISYDFFRITIIGVFFMIFLFVLPLLISKGFDFKEFKIGGTGFLIIVGVSIETLQQISSTANKEDYAKIF
ncbi:Preprotein translocase subunit SecY [Candidatus Phytoplasma mali]|uniref:Protein translocase subunit SecY n=5 Tax=Apple proliferation phytoplasma TaxID=37692 RepID=B3R011_PHYMT|nr:SecY family transport protein [Candidatus Phytoplasma mali]ADO33806.1 protein translocase [Candidatus Phytoplasma mali]CAP18548.1 Preprotein translocase subunit SecY [Candidatus Phytoplasma mali]